ncbi:MAG: Gfo/Idh/MocA family oxidoreductase [Cyclobacteriaceae bacterium]
MNFFNVLVILLASSLLTYGQAKQPLRVGVVGLVHTHVHWILGREDVGDIEIVGIVEPNRTLAEQYSRQHGYPMDLVFDSIEEMVEATKPEAVTAFNSIYEHLKVVEYCAPRGIHVMVEKPLAVSWEHAQKMAALARQHDIALLTNYETSWYGSNYEAYKRVRNNEIGEINRLVFHHGHPGPIEIGCNPEFLEWLTDPVLNGGGALTDFGCYGANLATWMLQGQQPTSVQCITRQYKPDMYPKVEDDATIIVNYESTQVIIQASWAWSHNRKDMEVYGKNGYIIAKDGTNMEIMTNEQDGFYAVKAKALANGIHDPFAYLQQVVQEDMKVDSFGVSSLENNLIVMQILEAAKYSAKTGRLVKWNELFND